MGSGGAKTCWECQNVCSPYYRFWPDPSGFCVPYSCMEPNRFVKQDMNLIRSMLRKLAEVAATGDADALAELEISYGFNYREHGWLFRESSQGLDLHEVVMWDWFHTWVQGGVCDNEMTALFKILDKTTVGREALHEYLQLWMWPHGYASAAGVAEKGKVDGSGSELLSLLPVLALFLTNVFLPDGVATEAALSMLACIEVMDLLMNCLGDRIVSPEQLDAAILKHAKARLKAYGDSLSQPKSHYQFHLSRALRVFGFLISTFTQE